jgi:TPR repeat protein
VPFWNIYAGWNWNQRDLTSAIRYLKLSAEQGSVLGQFLVALMSEYIETSVDILLSVQYYESISRLIP